MLLFRLLLVFLLVTSCGFSPIYSDQNLKEIKGDVAIYVNGESNILKRELKELLGNKLGGVDPNKTPKYNLEIKLSKTIEEFAVTRYSYATRSKVNIYASYKITELENGEVVDAGTVGNSSSFDLSQTSEYSNYIAEQYSEKNNLNILSDEIIMRVLAIIFKSEDLRYKNAD
jgi:hypothetical protein